MFIFIILTLSINEGTALDLRPGKPVPHADVLESIIKSQLGNASDHTGLLSHYLEGEDDITDTENEDFNVNVLDITSVRSLVNVFKRKYERELASSHKGNSTFRRNQPQAINGTLAPRLIQMAFLMMQQSIYATRYRLQDTNEFRNKFKADPSYNIAILAGSMDMILMKMDNLLTEMQEMYMKTHFLWYLIIYEKILTMVIDVGYMANRIWALHKQLVDAVNEEQKEGGAPDMGLDSESDEATNATAKEAEASPPESLHGRRRGASGISSVENL